ncbi:beta-glucosidase [Paenibacillus sp. strain BS8-2]
MDKPWLDQQKSIDERTLLLLDAMTLDDKLAMMHGGEPSLELDLPIIKLSDGPGGVTSGEGATAPGTQMPAPIALGATFDRVSAYNYGSVLGIESRNRGITILLAPTVNIARSALNGRTFESYGEDPYLSGILGAQFVKGVQDQGVIANVKHFAANNQETDRFIQNSMIDERTLREIYLPAFEAAVVEGKAGTVMASYNQINGVAGTEHHELLTQILKKDWGFEGFVISDFLATQSTAEALLAGLDYELTLPFQRYFGEPLKRAVESGQIPSEKIDEAAGRILRTLFRSGHFEKQHVNSSPPLYHPDAARQAALDSIVLLKNEDDILPLNNTTKIAVIGQAASNRMIASGGGSAHVVSDSITSPIDGIKHHASHAEVTYALGTTPVPAGPRFMYGSPNEDLVIPAESYLSGLTATYFETNDLSGNPVRTEKLDLLNIVWGFDSPMPKSAKWTGFIKPAATKIHTFYLPASGGSRLFVNGQLLLDNWQGQAFYGMAEAMLHEGELAEVEIHFTSDGAPPALSCIALHWVAASNHELIQEAAQLAKESDVAIVFVNDFMTENYDKPNLALPGVQDRLVEAVASSNPNTIVVLNTGGPVLMPWAHQVKAIIELWYPGQEGGNAIGSILFGEHDPSGRLPLSFPAMEEEVPASTSSQFPGIGLNSVYSEGLLVGYRWYDAKEKQPLFPFGHGLSYTSFIYEGLDVKQTNDVVRVSFRVRNTGDRDGICVPQLYVGFSESSGEAPKQLKACRKVPIPVNGSEEIVFELNKRAFSVWSTTQSSWIVADHAFEVMIGHSSHDIMLSRKFELYCKEEQIG